MPAIIVIRMHFSRRLESCSSSSPSRCCWANCHRRPSARSTTCTCMTPSFRCVLKCASNAGYAACNSYLTCCCGKLPETNMSALCRLVSLSATLLMLRCSHKLSLSSGFRIFSCCFCHSSTQHFPGLCQSVLTRRSA